MKKINVSNVEKITSALQSAELKTRVRKLDPAFLVEAVKRAEKQLGTLLLKKDWKGIRVLVDAAGGERFPSSYQGVPESTQLTLEFSGSTWFVTSVERSRVYKRKIDILNLLSKKEELLHFAIEHNSAA